MSLKTFLLFFLPVLCHSACPDGYVKWNSECYFFGTNETQFAAAETICDNLGGNLASIHDGFVNALLTQNSVNYFHASVDIDFWVGGTNLMSPPNWNWTDGTSFDFQEWQKPPPYVEQSCLAINMNNGSWSPQECFKSKSFVCKINETSPTPFPTVANCTVGWYYLDITQSCYGTVTSAQTNSWNNSEAACQTYGAHLPSIHSYEEETFLRIFAWVTNVNIWIGMYSNDYAERTFNWTDGTDVDYVNWFPGYPIRNIPSCVGLASKGFYDDSCTGGQNKWQICKKPLHD